LWHQLAACKSFEERTAIVEAWALGKSISLHHQELAISQFLTGPDEAASVSGLAATFCYSTRQLHRKVQELFGMSSEVLLRYKRYHQALHSIHHSDQILTSIAHACGYYDQAHFNREFREFTGLTPGNYRRQRSHLAGHLFQ
jgi:AraC-like DNA-binding protein